MTSEEFNLFFRAVVALERIANCLENPPRETLSVSIEPRVDPKSCS